MVYWKMYSFSLPHRIYVSASSEKKLIGKSLQGENREHLYFFLLFYETSAKRIFSRSWRRDHHRQNGDDRHASQRIGVCADG